MIDSDRYTIQGDTPLTNGRYTEKSIEYDLNGSPLTIKRYGRSASRAWHNLSLGYSGSRVSAVTGTISRNQHSQLPNLVQINTSYSYDQNGNMTADGLEGITIEYDINNLPLRIRSTIGDTLTTYLYFADGEKGAVVSGKEINLSNGANLYNRAQRNGDRKGEKKVESGLRSSVTVVGRRYIGPFTISIQSDGEQRIESIADSQWRIVYVENAQHLALCQRYTDLTEANNNDPTTMAELNATKGQIEETAWLSQIIYHRDHLGSVRVITLRWNTQDPLAEKYYRYSPYSYCINDPVMYIDVNGLSYSEFDENGNYLRTIKDNWWHNLWHGRKGRIVDNNGNVLQTFKFADPKNDIADLKNKTITKLYFVKESDIISMLSRAGAFNEKNKVANAHNRYGYILKEAKGKGKFDFSYSGITDQYPEASSDPMKKPSSMLFLVDRVAHNHMNFGNFLYGAAGRALGLTSFELTIGAHWNSLVNALSNGYDSQLDSCDDQFSIRQGVKHANRHGYKTLYYKAFIEPLIFNGFSY